MLPTVPVSTAAIAFTTSMPARDVAEHGVAGLAGAVVEVLVVGHVDEELRRRRVRVGV